MASTIFIVRHGEAKSNAEKYFSGWGGSPLSSLGREQAKLLHTRLAKEKIRRAFCSDTARAKETFDLLSIRCPVVYTKALREKNYGRLEGVVWGDNEEKYARYHLDPYIRAPGGENTADVQKRAWDFISSRVFAAKEEKVLVVSHHGPIVLFACRFLGMPLSKWRALRLGNCGLCILVKEDNEWRLKLWNSLSHYGLLNFSPLLSHGAKAGGRKGGN